MSENGLVLKAGAIVAVPTPGLVTIFSDASGAIFKIDSAGTVTAVGSGAGGTVHADGVTITGDGSAGLPLAAAAQFGADTTVSLLNSGSTPVAALELIASLTTSTPASEASQWLIKLLTAGAQVSAMQIGPTQTLVPVGSSTVPGIGFLTKSGWGIAYNSGINGTVVLVNGGIEMGVFTNTLMIYSSAAVISFGTGQTERILRSGLALIFQAGGTEQFRINNTGVSFYGGTPAAKQTVTGSKGANAALTSLMTALAAIGLVTDSTT